MLYEVITTSHLDKERFEKLFQSILTHQIIMPEKKRIYAISRRIAFPAFLTIVLFVTSIFFIILPQLEKSFIARKQEMIREQVETTWSLLNDYHNREP